MNRSIKQLQPLLFASVFLLTLSFPSSTLAQNSSIKVLTWTTLEEFLEGGWVLNVYEDEPIPVRNTSKPSDVSDTLWVLDDESENSVWGFWNVEQEHITPEFVLRYQDRPEICGMTSAEITFKYYEYGVGMALHPCDGREPEWCGFPFQRYVYWEIQHFRLFIPKEHNPEEKIRLYMGMRPGSMMVIDRIDLNYTTEYRPECNQTVLY